MPLLAGRSSKTIALHGGELPGGVSFAFCDVACVHDSRRRTVPLRGYRTHGTAQPYEAAALLNTVGDMAQERNQRGRPRIKLWHLFAVVTLSAVLVWLWPRLGLEADHRPGVGSRAVIVWNSNKRIKLWDTFQLQPHERYIILTKQSDGTYVIRGK